MEDDDPPTLRDLRTSEAAYATWKVMERTGYDYRLLSVRHGPVCGYEDGVWSRETGDDLLRRVTLDSLGPTFPESVLSSMGQHRIASSRIRAVIASSWDARSNSSRANLTFVSSPDRGRRPVWSHQDDGASK